MAIIANIADAMSWHTTEFHNNILWTINQFIHTVSWNLFEFVRGINEIVYFIHTTLLQNILFSMAHTINIFYLTLRSFTQKIHTVQRNCMTLKCIVQIEFVIQYTEIDFVVTQVVFHSVN